MSDECETCDEQKCRYAVFVTYQGLEWRANNADKLSQPKQPEAAEFVKKAGEFVRDANRDFVAGRIKAKSSCVEDYAKALRVINEACVIIEHQASLDVLKWAISIIEQPKQQDGAEFVEDFRATLDLHRQVTNYAVGNRGYKACIIIERQAERLAAKDANLNDACNRLKRVNERVRVKDEANTKLKEQLATANKQVGHLQHYIQHTSCCASRGDQDCDCGLDQKGGGGKNGRQRL